MSVHVLAYNQYIRSSVILVTLLVLNIQGPGTYLQSDMQAR